MVGLRLALTGILIGVVSISNGHSEINTPETFSGAPTTAPPPVIQSPVYALEKVEVFTFDGGGGPTVVRAQAYVPSENWSQPQLAITAPIGPDRILDLTFVATTTGVRATQTFTPQEAVFATDRAMGKIVGVRVRSATNVLNVNSTTGVTEAPNLSLLKCGNLIGLKLVPTKGSRNLDSEVAEIDLPLPHRLVGPNDVISDTSVNPNRLTVFLDNTQTIMAALWE